MCFERNMLVGMAALATASCATPQGPSFEVVPIDQDRLRLAQAVASIVRNPEVPARFRFLQAFPGFDVAGIQTQNRLNHITVSKENGVEALVVRMCAADMEEITEEPTCTGQPSVVFTDFGIDGTADEITIETYERDDVPSYQIVNRLDPTWDESRVQNSYREVLGEVYLHGEPII